MKRRRVADVEDCLTRALEGLVGRVPTFVKEGSNDADRCDHDLGMRFCASHVLMPDQPRTTVTSCSASSGLNGLLVMSRR
jgi:hypothetical protein